MNEVADGLDFDLFRGSLTAEQKTGAYMQVHTFRSFSFSAAEARRSFFSFSSSAA